MSGYLLGLTPTPRTTPTQDLVSQPLHPAPKSSDPLRSPKTFQPAARDLPNECSETQWKSDAGQIRPSGPAERRLKGMSS